MPNTPEKAGKTFTISCQPGIKRDGTQLDGDFYADGQWVRFRNGRPKKMGGYRAIVNGLNGPIRTQYVYSAHPLYTIFNFSGSGIECVNVDNNCSGSAVFDRTPAGYSADDNNLWQYDLLYDSSGGGANVIVAHPGTNLDDIDSDVATDVYYGTASAATALTAVGEQVSGGCCVLGPYLFIYGSNGLIKNSAVNNPTDFATGDANEANIGGTKIVKGISVRGGGSAPAGLFWSLDQLIKVSFIGGTAKWRYDPLAQTSILSSSAVIEYDGVYFWPGIDRFLMYNGAVKEVPNPYNQDYFFDNLNWAYRQKVWAMKIPRWGEIWWVFPKGDSTEPNWAVIFNVRENTWYDTPLDRAAGYPARVLRFPVMSDSIPNTDTGSSKYRIWQHEFGTDRSADDDQVAIESYFQTADLGLATGGVVGNDPEGVNQWLKLNRIEPDFVQVGDLQVEVLGSVHSRSEEQTLSTKIFSADTDKIDVEQQARILRLKFTSNTQGGDYMLGKTILQVDTGDIRD